MKLSILVTPEQWRKLLDFIQNYFLSRPCTILAIILLITSFILTIKSIKDKSKKKQVIALICYIGLVIIFSIVNRDVGTARELRLYFDPWLLENGTGFHESNVLISIIDCLYFIPIGFLLRLNKWHSLILSFVFVLIFGFSIELFQYILIRGVASISDFTSYIVGGLIGILLAQLINRS